MTRIDPTLILKHLIVLKDGRAVYDQSFRPGVNIIRGENGSGKSTIAEFIFYALGGEVNGWTPEAGSCDFTYAEVQIRGESITLRREIAPEKRRPISIYWGGLNEAREQGVTGWETFPFQTSARKASFSQVLFRLLGLPEVFRDDLQARITMHQILRLLYVDQRTPYDHIFLQDDWDQQLTRDAIGDLLLGTYDDTLYQLRLDVRDLDGQLSRVQAELRSIGEILAHGERALTPDALNEAIANARAAQTLFRERLAELSDTNSDGALHPPDIRAATKSLKRHQNFLRQLTGRLESINFEIQDSDDLIRALEDRIEALVDADTTRRAFGAAAFVFCPSCYSRLETENDAICSVCKSSHGDGITPNILRLRHELTSQLRESQTLQDDRSRERDELVSTLSEAAALHEKLQAKLDLLTDRAVSSAEAARAEIYEQVGYLERQVEDLHEKRKLAERLESLEAKRSEIEAQLAKAKDELHLRQQAVLYRRGEAQQKISDITVELLHRDIPRERAFETAEYVTFDFGKNSLAVDGRANFAASSMVYLKNSFHLAMLMTSLQLDYLRYPRFVLFDNIEDKGMEPTRSHNFQELILEYSKGSEVEHQIILTTSMIHPELNNSEHVVGPYYTHDNRTLDIST